MKKPALTMIGGQEIKQKGCLQGRRIHRESHGSKSRVPRLSHRTTLNEVQLWNFRFSVIAFVPVKTIHIDA